MSVLISILKVLGYILILALSLGALWVGDLHRTMMEGAVPEPMFFPPPYMPIKSPHNLRTPKWTEEELAAKEQEMSEKIGAIERAYYSHRYHQLTPDVNNYRGGKNDHGEREGVGRVELDTGDIYMGEWRKNLRHGVGGVIFAGGDIYETEWAFGDPHGFGVLKLPDGYRYTGEFIAGEPNGYGRARLPGRMQYEGTFREGKFHGYGNWTNFEQTYQGSFVDGKREGEGKLLELKTSKIIFEGLFRNDQPVRAGWQPKPKVTVNPNTNTHQSLGTTQHAIDESEQEIHTLSFVRNS